MGRYFQKQSPQIGHKVNRGHPTDEERNDGNGKNSKGVFTRQGFGQTNGQKASRRNEGAREHGHGCELIGEGGGTDFVIALLHFSDHHFDGNDGIVYQQSQRNDE